MSRRKRYSRTNLIFFLIICCIVLIYFLSKDTFSLFESEIEGDSNTDIAFYVLEDSLQTHELFLGNMSPGESQTIAFYVQNYNEDEDIEAEVDMTYSVKLKCTENLPLNINLYEDSTLITNKSFAKDDYGTWFLYINVPQHTLTHGVREKHNYILNVEFSADEIDKPQYQDLVEAIEVTVESKQVIE